MPNFSSLARLEVPEKFLWVGWGGVGWGLQSHFRVKPNRCVVLCWGWDFDKYVYEGGDPFVGNFWECLKRNTKDYFTSVC